MIFLKTAKRKRKEKKQTFIKILVNFANLMVLMPTGKKG